MTEFESREADWLPVAEAVQRTLGAARPLPPEEASLEEALGRALADSLTARATLPPWNNSAMDGYAVRAADIEGAGPDTPTRLRVVGDVRAGGPAEIEVAEGSAVRIMTGAPVPAGADSVVRVEHTDQEAESGWVEICSDGDSGRNIRPAGQDMTEGDVVLAAGLTLSPGALAVASAMGHAKVPVRGRPRVALLSSGDELRDAEGFDDVIAGLGIPETNSVVLEASTRLCGAVPLPLGIARDDVEDIRGRVAEAQDADLLVTTGGASMGEADLFKRALLEAGLEIDFWRVRMRPGSPVSLGFLPRGSDRGPLPVLGLPGNPASAFVTFEVFARPLILRLAGHSRIHRRVIGAIAGEPLVSTPRLTHYHRVTLTPAPEEPPVARLSGPPSSGLVRGLGFAEGLAVVPESVGRIDAGDSVEVMLLNDVPGSNETLGYRSTVP